MMHLPENIWQSPVIRKRLAHEASFESSNGKANKPHYWIQVPDAATKRGLITLKNYDATGFHIDPHEMQQEFAKQLQAGLQRQMGEGGLWIVGWTHPPASWNVMRTDGDNVWDRLVMIWLDEDADPQYTVESDLPFIEMIESGVEYYLKLASEAHAMYAEHYGKRAQKDDFGIKESQTTKEVLASMH